MAQTIDTPVKNECDILFIGASVYWGGIDNHVKEFIKGINKEKIGKVVVFSTSALAERAFPEMKKLLLEQNIKVEQTDFYTRGQFTLMHKGKPDRNDLKSAADFARKILN